jgi:hypothetical protein
MIDGGEAAIASEDDVAPTVRERRITDLAGINRHQREVVLQTANEDSTYIGINRIVLGGDVAVVKVGPARILVGCFDIVCSVDATVGREIHPLVRNPVESRIGEAVMFVGVGILEVAISIRNRKPRGTSIGALLQNVAARIVREEEVLVVLGIDEDEVVVPSLKEHVCSTHGCPGNSTVS